ncbi:precorrin-6Y C5,15-methyltransferase (decarboxylating) subunit CbiT [Actinocatenispora comari]|uniref:precorrin-6Y C5,15-methyltransferase (decarboxylating) subunit CbiT n=1 Tax=Actinocatenispora comari TaxID=2807577 RepID=UPI001A930F75|nr:precorrin-6Y C5,15-methyltransferase (decarboxylating) subunit CbiT [Actinocatenispora comari]
MRLHVVGIGADGWPGLTEPVRTLVRSAGVLLGAPRQLALVPAIDGQRRIEWPSPLRDRLPALLADLAGHETSVGMRRRSTDADPAGCPVVALASGDPLVAGIGSTLVELLGPDAVTVVPAVSSVALARARLGWPAETTVVVRDPGTVARHLAPGRRILVLSTDASTPGTLAATLVGHGFGASGYTVLARLGAADETITRGTAAAWVGDAPALHVLAIECAGATRCGLVTGLPDDAYEHDGQLTRRDLRASALARLVPQPGQLLWDVGAGAGSVGIEWLRAHPTCRAVAVERDPDRAARIGRNAATLGVPGLRVVTGSAGDVLAELPPPDAVFVGGGATSPGVLDGCWAALRPGGRLVVHGVTLETETLLAGWYSAHGGELSRIQVESAAPLGRLTGWTPARVVTQWAVTR